MIGFDGLVDVERAPADLREFLGDPANAPRWLAGVTAAEGPRETARFDIACLGHRLQVRGRLVEDAAAGRLLFTADQPFPISVQMALRPFAGGTRVLLRVEAAPGAYFDAPERVVGTIMRRRYAADLLALREILEAEPTPV
jgi:hypothetical protein